MGLNIFDNDTARGAGKRFSDDVVGRFRSGYQVDGTPAALNEWRVTTGDPTVADSVYRLLGGDAPQEWAAKGEDKIEVFTAASEVDVIVESPERLSQRMVLWGRNGKPIYISDGATIVFPDEDKGKPDPDAGLKFAERKARARNGNGAEPQIELVFRLADEPDLGMFKFQSGSWSLANDLNYYGVEDELADVDGPALVTLGLEQVSFVAKNGPRAGQTVSYTKPTVKVKGAA